jgi:hypothetical protein
MSTEHHFRLCGGKFGSSELADFLDRWTWKSFDMTYMILETIPDGLLFESVEDDTWLAPIIGTLGDDLLRLHVFGTGGDLTIRRDDDWFYWRYIGYKHEGIEDIPVQIHIYKEATLRIDNKRDRLKTILWGGYSEEHYRRHENRVGSANLDYPINTMDRVVVEAVEVLGAGDDVVAIWTRGLVGYEENQ